MFRKIANFFKGLHFSLRTKLLLSFSSVAVVLLISSIISMMEYSRMSNYVTELIADDIYSINASQKISTLLDGYNLQILTAIGDSSVTRLPDFDQERFVASCDSLKASFSEAKLLPLADSVLYSYQAYMLTSLELESVIQSTFINSRSWYFGRLQPTFNRLRRDIDNLNEGTFRPTPRPSSGASTGASSRGPWPWVSASYWSSCSCSSLSCIMSIPSTRCWIRWTTTGLTAGNTIIPLTGTTSWRRSTTIFRRLRRRTGSFAVK